MTKVLRVGLKPATGRPFVPAFSLSGTVPAFMCDCLRFVCVFTRRRKFDLCVSTSSRTMLAFEKKSVARIAHVLLLRFVAGNMDVNTLASKRSEVIRKHSDCSRAPNNPQKVDLCVLASFSCRVYAVTQGRKVRPVVGFRLTCLQHPPRLLSSSLFLSLVCPTQIYRVIPIGAICGPTSKQTK